MMNYQELKEELKRVSEKAPFGAHSKVSDAVGISEVYSQKIRKHKGAKLDSKDNRELIQKMIKEYKSINLREAKKLAS